VGKLQLGEAIRACCLQSSVTTQSLHYHVKMARNKKLEQHMPYEGITIEVDSVHRSSCDTTSDMASVITTISPLTEGSSLCLLSSTGTAAECDHGNNASLCKSCINPITNTNLAPETRPSSSSSADKENFQIQTRRSSRQACHARVEAKMYGLEYNHRFKAAYKEATEEAANQNGAESVACLVARLNTKYNLNGKRKLSRSTIYRSVQQGHVGQSPCKMGPPPSIPNVLLDVLAAHSEVSQVGNGGELRGRDFKRLIGAAVLGTRHENKFKVDSAWKKLRTAHPEKIQATKIATARPRG
jgi:hypothetical protein